MAIGPCMWSGVETTTASMSLCILSKSLRKSSNVSAFGCFFDAAPSRCESTSQSATMRTFLPFETLLRSPPPIPPTPTFATFRVSNGVGSRSRFPISGTAATAALDWMK